MSSTATSGERPRTSALAPIVGGGIGLVVAGASWAGLPILTAVIVVLVLLASLEVAVLWARVGVRLPKPAAAAAGLLPLGAYRWGEEGLGIGAGLVIAVVLGLFVLRGRRPGSLASMAAAAFVIIYLGLLASYPVLIRGFEHGHRLTLAFVTIVVAYHLARWPGTTRLRSPAVVPAVGNSPTWGGLAAGVLGSTAGALVATAMGFGLASVLVLGFAVGVAAGCGDLAGSFLLSEFGVGERESAVPGMGGLIARLSTALVAAPACFYGFKLYLV